MAVMLVSYLVGKKAVDLALKTVVLMVDALDVMMAA